MPVKRADTKRNFSRWPRLLLILSLPLFCSCYPVQNAKALREALQSLPPPTSTGSPPEGYREVRGAIHVHSNLSHDSKGTPEEILQAARESGLQFLIMTDHSNPLIFEEGMHGWREGILVVRGMEIIQNGTSLLGIGMKEYFNHRQMPLQEVVDQVKAQGALVFIAHPRTYRGWPGLQGVDGMEIYDIYDDAIDHKLRFIRYLSEILFAFDRYPDEVFLSILDRPARELADWDQRSSSQKMVGIAGNDAHQNIRVLGRQLDPYSRSFRFVNTHLFVPTLDEPSLLRALARGNGFVSFDLLADATGFLFGVQDAETFRLMGESAPFQKGMKLVARAPRSGKARLLRNGEVVSRAQGTTLTFSPQEKGVYRVEWLLRIGDRWWPWIYSNPIYLT